MLVSLALAANIAFNQDSGHFQIVGPLAKLLPEGKSPGVAPGGVPFSFVVTPTGLVTGTDIKVQVSASGSADLALSDTKYSLGQLDLNVKCTNSSGANLQGVRFDLDNAIETYKSKDKDGKEVLLVRTVPITSSGPLYFGDMQNGLAIGSFPESIGGLNFKPESTQIVVHGRLSGYQWVRNINVPETSSRGYLDVDSDNRIYVGDTVSNGVVRIDADGKNSRVIAKVPDQTCCNAMNPKTGRMVIRCGNHPKLFFFTKTGDEDGTSPEGLDDLGWCDVIRYDPSGRLWARYGSSLHRFGADGKPEFTATKIGDFDFTSDCQFDIAPDNTLWIVTDHTLRFSKDQCKTGKAVAKPGFQLGELILPDGVRCDASGYVYVSETYDQQTHEADRISIFDPSGRFVRAIGRGGDKPHPDFNQNYLESEVDMPFDIAFGKDGTLYVSELRPEAGGIWIGEFKPF